MTRDSTNTMAYVPPRGKPRSNDRYFEVLTQAVFQCGLSWDTVRKKWPGFRKAFEGFKITKVAAFTPLDVARLMQDATIIRNRKKIEATIENARAVMDILAEHGSFRNYLRSFEPWHYGTVVRAMRKRFYHVGTTAVFFFLYSVGEEVPSWHDRKNLD